MRHIISASMLAMCATAAADARPVAIGDQVALRSAHGTYLVAESDGRANADRGAVGGYERFTVQTASGRSAPALPISRGDRIALRSHHGTYLVAESDGRANADRVAVGGYEQWTALGASGEVGGPVECGSSIALRSFHGTYLVAESDGRANADRGAIGGWERFTVECHSAAVERYSLEIGGGAGARITFTAEQLTVDADGTLHLAGSIELEAAGQVSAMTDAQVHLVLDGAGRIETMWGQARVFPAASVNGADYRGGMVGEVGLRYGHELGHLGAPLRDAVRYVYVDLTAEAGLTAGPLSAQFGAGATWVLDPADPFVFARGTASGLGELTVFESLAVGVSAHGRIPLRARHDWGFDSTPAAEGHVYLQGRFGLPRVPVTVDGELLIGADADGDGQGLLDGRPEMALLANGAGEVNVGFGPFTAVQFPIAAGSFGGRAIGEDVEVWFSGRLGADAREVLPAMPFEMSGYARVAGRLGSDPARLFARIGADVHVAGLTLAEAVLHIEPAGATLSADVDLQTVSVGVRGAVGPGQLALSGVGRIALPVVGPRTITEAVDVAVQYTADAAVCGYETVVDGAICGTHTVTDAARCGTRTITDGAICGYDVVVDWYCQTFGGCSSSARSCAVANTCEVASSCQVAASCTRIEQREQQRQVPDFDWGVLRSDVTVGLDGQGLSAAGRLDYCAFDTDVCAPLSDGGFEVDGAGIRACGDIAGLGRYCVAL